MLTKILVLGGLAMFIASCSTTGKMPDVRYECKNGVVYKVVDGSYILQYGHSGAPQQCSGTVY